MATAHDGRKLAVKVQHAGLRETCAADIATIDALVRTVRVIFPVGELCCRACMQEYMQECMHASGSAVLSCE